MSHHSADAFLRLHVPAGDRHTYGAAPALREGFVAWLDRASGPPRPGTLAVPLTLDEALVRLAREFPPLAEAVDLCCIEGHTLRVAAAMVGVCHRTVRERKMAGIARLVVWSGLSEAQVNAALCPKKGHDRRLTRCGAM